MFFQPLSRESYTKIAALMLDELVEPLQERGIALTYTDAACQVLAEQAVKATLADYYRRRGIDPVPIVGEIKEFDHDHEEGGSCSCGL